MVRGNSAFPKVPHEPAVLRTSAQHAWLRRWESMLVCSTAQAFRLSLVDRRGANLFLELCPLAKKKGFWVSSRTLGTLGLFLLVILLVLPLRMLFVLVLFLPPPSVLHLSFFLS